MKVRATRLGFIGGNLKQVGDVFEAKQAASWYVPVEEEKPVKPAAPAKAGKETKVGPAAPAVADLT